MSSIKVYSARSIQISLLFHLVNKIEKNPYHILKFADLSSILIVAQAEEHRLLVTSPPGPELLSKSVQVPVTSVQVACRESEYNLNRIELRRDGDRWTRWWWSGGGG